MLLSFYQFLDPSRSALQKKRSSSLLESFYVINERLPPLYDLSKVFLNIGSFFEIVLYKVVNKQNVTCFMKYAKNYNKGFYYFLFAHLPSIINNFSTSFFYLNPLVPKKILDRTEQTEEILFVWRRRILDRKIILEMFIVEMNSSFWFPF